MYCWQTQREDIDLGNDKIEKILWYEMKKWNTFIA